MLKRLTKRKTEQRAQEAAVAGDGGIDADSFLASILKLGGNSKGSAKDVEVFDAGLIDALTPESQRKSAVDKDQIAYVPKSKPKKASKTKSPNGSKAEREPTQFSSFLRRGANSLQSIKDVAEDEADEGRTGSAGSRPSSGEGKGESAAAEARRLAAIRSGNVGKVMNAQRHGTNAPPSEEQGTGNNPPPNRFRGMSVSRKVNL